MSRRLPENGPRDVTVVMAFYDNPTMLKRHYEMMRGYDDETRSRMRLIIVDDGSPRWPAEPGDPGLPLEIYRMKVDVRWNQDACRNLGVARSKTPWVLLTDIDHMIPAKTARYVTRAPLSRSIAYRFSRVNDPNMDPYKPHPNSWLMTKEVYEKVGGYDERFAGYYGTDGDFRNRVSDVVPLQQLDAVLIRVPREVTPDASTTTYKRKDQQDSDNIPRIMAERAAIPNWRPLRLLFPWEKVYPTEGGRDA